MNLSRREAVVAGGVALMLPAARRSDPRAKFLADLANLERGLGPGARIGLVVTDPISGRSASRRAAERFPMCSTFKLLLTGQVLWRVDRGHESLTRAVAIPASGIVDNSPVTGAHAGGSLTVAELCEATMTRSDNTAANLLLATLGGPAGLTRFLRGTGDAVTRLDRIEQALNEGAPGDPRDTTTPAAMLDTLRRLTFGVLSPRGRAQLIAWLRANTTGETKLKKGLPPGWTIGDKTGAGGHMSNNDVALIWPAGRDPAQPIFAAVFVTGGPGDDTLSRNPVHARIGAMIGELLGSG